MDPANPEVNIDGEVAQQDQTLFRVDLALLDHILAQGDLEDDTSHVHFLSKAFYSAETEL